MADPPARADAETPATRDRAKVTAATVLGAVAALFAAFNLDDVKVRWIVSSTRTPLILVIAVSFGLGAGVGALAARRAARK